MSTMNLKPGNLLILAALGIGAYWFVTKRARAATARAPAATYRAATGGNTANRPTSPNLTQGLLAGLDTWINGQSQATNLPGSLDANVTNSSTAYLESSTIDDINGLF